MTISNIEDITSMSPVGDMVDALGELRAEMAQQKCREKILMNMLKGKGVTEAKGVKYRVTIAYNIIRKTVDWKSFIAQLNPPRELVQAYTTLGEQERVQVQAIKAP